MTILILDDDQLILKSLRRALQREGYRVLTASSGQEAVEAARQELLDLIICDVRMPEVDGLDTLGLLRGMQEGLRSIVITGYASEDAPIRAIKQGVDDYLLKPVPVEALLRSVRHSLELRRLELANRETVEQLKRRYLQIITTLVGAFQDQDSFFYEHSRRVAALAVDLGTELGLDPASLDRLELAGLLHDVGLAYIDRDLLLKAERLAEQELEQLRSHPLLARGLLEQVPGLSEVAPILHSLREHYDGSGAPEGRRGEAIPIESRILAVAEAYDSLTHDRPHRPAGSPEAALEVLRKASRTHFDPVVVSLCADLALETRSLTDPRQLLGRSPARQATREKFGNLERLGNLFREAGQHDLARSAYQAAQQLLAESPEPDLSAMLLVHAGQLALAQADGARAGQLAGQARREAEPLGGPRRDHVLLELGRLYLGLERPAQAADVLMQVSEASSATRDWLLLRTYLGTRQREPFRQRFPGWLGALRPHSLSPAQGQDAVELLVAGLHEGLAPGECREALTALLESWPALREKVRQQLPEAESWPVPSPGPAPEAAPTAAPHPALEIHCFGRMRVAVDGQVVDPKAWTTRKAQELFALLVLHQRPVSAARITELLWPEGSDKVKKNLHTTVSRVRRALRSGSGRELSIISNDRDFYFLDPHLAAWADIWEFERAVESISRLKEPRLSPELEREAQAAVELCEGDFLEGIWEDWAQEPRTTFREKWFRLLERLATHHLGAGEFERALMAYERMLERETCREEAHLGLMRCCLKQGRRDTAVRRYHEYVRTLERELGLTPSAEAMNLYYEIIDSGPR